jgi:flagellar biosynthetic protein FliQ
MSENDSLILVLQNSILFAIKISLPILISSVVVGLGIGIFQSVTQVQDASISFVPKLIVIGIILFLIGPWILNSMVLYTGNIFNMIGDICLVK